MTALIKTIIAAVIGMFGSLEMEQTTADSRTLHLEPQTYLHCDYYRPLDCCQNSVTSRVWLKLSSAS